MSDKEKDVVYVDLQSNRMFDNAREAEEFRQKLIEDEKERQHQKNPDFIQLTKRISPDILSAITKENPLSLRVLMFFFKNMDHHNVLMVSQSVIADKLERSRQAISNAIKILEKQGAIGIGKISNANVYIINPEIAWQRTYRERNIVKLKGNFILGKDENEKLFQKFKELEKEKDLYDLKIDDSLSLKNYNKKI